MQIRRSIVYAIPLETLLPDPPPPQSEKRREKLAISNSKFATDDVPFFGRMEGGGGGIYGRTHSSRMSRFKSISHARDLTPGDFLNLKYAYCAGLPVLGRINPGKDVRDFFADLHVNGH